MIFLYKTNFALKKSSRYKCMIFFQRYMYVYCKENSTYNRTPFPKCMLRRWRPKLSVPCHIISHNFTNPLIEGKSTNIKISSEYSVAKKLFAPKVSRLSSELSRMCDVTSLWYPAFVVCKASASYQFDGCCWQRLKRTRNKKNYFHKKTRFTFVNQKNTSQLRQSVSGFVKQKPDLIISTWLTAEAKHRIFLSERRLKIMSSSKQTSAHHPLSSASNNK